MYSTIETSRLNYSQLKVEDLNLLTYIKDYLAEVGQPPSLNLLGISRGTSVKSVKRVLTRLKLRREIYWQDEIEYLKPLPLWGFGVPIVGRVEAQNQVILSNLNLQIPDLTLIWVGEYFGLRVSCASSTLQLATSDILVMKKTTGAIEIELGKTYLEQTGTRHPKLANYQSCAKIPIAQVVGVWKSGTIEFQSN
ncbi:hypothetical protein [Chamaesiphon sp.]|uniref:hypothetical protein n=1 Tax=Chamaesiphon sp. TaxID=2814140 RepID=UPI00359373A2